MASQVASAKAAVRAALRELGAAPSKLSVRRIFFTDLARAECLQVTVYGVPSLPRPLPKLPGIIVRFNGWPIQ